MLWHSLALCIWQFPPSWTWIVLKSVLLPPGREQESFPDSWYYQHNSVRGNDGHTFFFASSPTTLRLGSCWRRERPMKWGNHYCRYLQTFSGKCVEYFSHCRYLTLVYSIFLKIESGFSEASSSTLDFYGVRASLAMSSSTDFRPCRRIGSNYSRKGGDPSVAF